MNPHLPFPPTRRSLARRGLLVAAIGAAIGIVWGYALGSIAHAFVYSESISLLSWVYIDGGRWLFGRGWPGNWPPGWRGVLLVLSGSTFGFVDGTSIGDAVYGNSSWANFAAQPRMMVASIAGSLLVGTSISMFFVLRGHKAWHVAEMARAERDASLARLALLQSQLEPHMLFNTLANLRVLIGQDPVRATAMLDRLIGFLRATLAASRNATQPLSAEFDRTADYLALMAVRMGARLRSVIDLPAGLRDLPTPSLLLQPLVENAIRHGLEPKIGGGRVEVRAGVDDQCLCLEVVDDGVGIEPGFAAGFGTSQVRERLATLFGADANFEIAPIASGGTQASIRIPIAALEALRSLPAQSAEPARADAGRVGNPVQASTRTANAAAAEPGITSGRESGAIR